LSPSHKDVCLIAPSRFIGKDGWSDLVQPALHRVSYAAAYGCIPEGHNIHHLCRTKACINPAHLIPLPAHIHLKLHQLEGKVAPPRLKKKCPCCDKMKPAKLFKGRYCKECMDWRPKRPANHWQKQKRIKKAETTTPKTTPTDTELPKITHFVSPLLPGFS